MIVGRRSSAGSQTELYKAFLRSLFACHVPHRLRSSCVCVLRASSVERSAVRRPAPGTARCRCVRMCVWQKSERGKAKALSAKRKRCRAIARTINLMSESIDRDQWDTRMFERVWRQQVMWRQHLMNQIFAWDVAGGQQMPPLLRRRRNMQEARSNYRSTSRNRTFGNIPLGMQ